MTLQDPRITPVFLAALASAFHVRGGWPPGGGQTV